MALDRALEEEIRKKHQLHEKDTGSADVQIAILTKRIAELTEHLKLHKKDRRTRLSLMIMIGRRQQLLNYLKSTNTERYFSITESLKLKK